jgi:UDP-sulfoquinovose synthase
MKKKIFVVGGDGFCGWPLSLRLANQGYDVIIIDNFSRRKIDRELNVKSLTPIYSLKERLKFWNAKKPKNIIKLKKINVCLEIEKLKLIIKKYKPYAIIMLAELKSAPYSVMSLKNANKNIINNLTANNNLLYLIKNYSKKSKFIHLGTMGVYGYDYSKKLVPDGYYNAVLKNHVGEKIKTKILHPASPGSIYHLSKAQDELLFQYYAKMYNLDITDLHQGIVWGVNTKECSSHKILYNRFDYDSVYGTLLNRFVAQAAINHKLTIYGSGNQIRPFINIEDSINCIQLSLKDKFKSKGQVRVMNQITETKKINDIAGIFLSEYGINKHNHKNLRIESENNKLKAKAIALKKLGHKGIKINAYEINKLLIVAKENIKRIKKQNILSKVKW